MAQSLYIPEPATIEKTGAMTATEKYFSIRLDSGKDLGHLPGQFVEVSILGIGEAPISVSSSPTQKGRFELVVRKVGNVTGASHFLTSQVARAASSRSSTSKRPSSTCCSAPTSCRSARR